MISESEVWSPQDSPVLHTRLMNALGLLSLRERPAGRIMLVVGDSGPLPVGVLYVARITTVLRTGMAHIMLGIEARPSQKQDDT